ncbi:hypothetical protein OMW55_13270 [Sphingomonas sp. BN140010]|uniref:Uncharacterized protein n=1 Tax=Sphingomonas arvum TaxID=2992113 RepID=A0ABT3JIB5_9SPHN|nr:hypothetical protein [Sphingomonas sp. BN140010]MCW3798779.1 hypothetical protein [Sphingomonas sp. BN140010]
MAVSSELQRAPSAASAHAARMAAAGSSGHPYAQDLGTPVGGMTAPRDLDDMVHLLTALYGRQPGPIDLALRCAPAGPARTFLAAAADSFERERQFLLRLSGAVGPMPSTPGQAETQAAMLAQRHALETLARSERHGCALGAATALVSDWRNIRVLLDLAARRVGCAVPACSLPDENSIADVLSDAASAPGPERAIRFGAEQLLLQHRALFDLLEARCDAREDF